jgi:hypothetical protein
VAGLRTARGYVNGDAAVLRVSLDVVEDRSDGEKELEGVFLVGGREGGFFFRGRSEWDIKDKRRFFQR